MFGRNRLERRLRAERPRPSDDFVRQMAARIEEDRKPVRRSSLRLGLALAVAAVSLVIAGLTGGLSYAADAVGHSFKSPAGSGSSASIDGGLVSAASTQYSAAGYYCFKTTMGNSYRETFISSQGDYDSITAQGWTAVRYDAGQDNQDTCNNGHIH